MWRLSLSSSVRGVSLRETINGMVGLSWEEISMNALLYEALHSLKFILKKVLDK